MTPAEAKAIIERRISLKNPPMAMLFKVEEDFRADAIRLSVSYSVPSRDTGEPARIYFVSRLTVEGSMPEDYVVSFAEDHIRRAFLHEFAETFHLDGVRVRDPHAGEP